MKTIQDLDRYINSHDSIKFREIYSYKDLPLEWSKQRKTIESNNSENEISDRLLCMMVLYDDVGSIIDFLNNSKKMNLQNIDNLLDYLFKRQEQKWCTAESIWVFSILNKNHNLINSAMNDKRFDFKYKNSFNTSIWCYLARYGEYDLLIKSIDEGRFDPKEVKDDFGATVWHYLALSRFYDKLIKAVDDRKFDPKEVKDDRGGTIWHYLASQGFYDGLIKAIDEGKFDPKEVKDNFGATVWHYLAKYGFYEKLVKGIDEGKFDPKEVKDNFGATVWHYLAKYGHYDKLVKGIDERKFDPKEVKDNKGATVWHYLAKYGFYDKLVKGIDDEKFDPKEVKDNERATVWHYLAAYGFYDLLSKAIDDKKFDPKEVKDNGGATVWHYLARCDFYDKLVKGIDERKFDPKEVKDNFGATVWHYLALCRFYDKLIKAIDDKKFDPKEVKDNECATVWHYLAAYGFYDLLSKAIDQGKFDPKEVKDNVGATVWHYLVRYGYYGKLIEAIDERKFDPKEVKDNLGATVWHYLAKYGFYDKLVKGIDEGKFDPKEVKDNGGATVWDYLAMAGFFQHLYQAVKNKLFTCEPNELCLKFCLAYLISSDKIKNIYLSRFIIDFDIDPHFVRDAFNSVLLNTDTGEARIGGYSFFANPDTKTTNDRIKFSLQLASPSIDSLQEIIDNDSHISCISYAVVFALYLKNVDKEPSHRIYCIILETILRKKFSQSNDIDRDLLEVFCLKLDKSLCSFVVDELDVNVAAEVIKELILKKSIYDTESIEIINSMIVSLNLTRLFEDESNKVEIIAPLLSSFMQKFLVQETISQLEDLKDFESRFKIMWSDERWANILGANEITKVDVHSSSTSSASELMFSEKNRTYYGAEKRERDLTSSLSTSEQNEPSSKLRKTKI